MLRFDYQEYTDLSGNSLWMPHVEVVLQHNGTSMTVFPALLDTGATYTVIPQSIASHLELAADSAESLSVSTASGESEIHKAIDPIMFLLSDSHTGECVEWESIVYISDELDSVLIGHTQCLENFDVTFRGKDRSVELVFLGEDSIADLINEGRKY